MNKIFFCHVNFNTVFLSVVKKKKGEIGKSFLRLFIHRMFLASASVRLKSSKDITPVLIFTTIGIIAISLTNRFRRDVFGLVI